MPKTNEREWESKLRDKFQDFADSIVWSNDTGDEKYIGVGNMCDWWIKEMSQLEASTIARCQKEERNITADWVLSLKSDKKYLFDETKLNLKEALNELCDGIASRIRSGITSLGK